MLNHLKHFAILLLILVQTACVTLAGHLTGELNGVVIDKSTGNPVEGAIVVAQWEGSVLHPVDSVTECFHVEVTTTDKNGRYRIAEVVATPLGIIDTQVYVSIVYKEGYRQVTYKDTQKPDFVKASRGVVHLIPAQGTVSERLAYLLRLSPPCESKRLLILYEAIYQEGSRIAVTKEEKISALHLLKDIEIIEIGSDNAWENFHERKRNIK